MPPRARKATFALDAEILAAVSEAVSQGIAPTKNAFVERALRKELRELSRQARRTAWEEASKDPLFLKDIEEVETDFASADAEAASRIG